MGRSGTKFHPVGEGCIFTRWQLSVLLIAFGRHKLIIAAVS
jgi:hypothetical protein